MSFEVLFLSVILYLTGIGKIIGNAIRSGFNSAHNNSNIKTNIHFYVNSILLSSLVLILYLGLTEKLPITNPKSLLKGLPAAIASCIALVVLHSITSNLAKLHYKQNINDMEK
ncbi:hypothetical protein [Bacillus subtilis]|uniref:hypothetical protein n=1 Tax=Bacillus subtilis TaxID=1423 RepID=UPI0013B98797|nr:hypothetical protein [Bacillus subtilis]KAF2427295.1 hypothetical protein B6K89_03685 [Bacillus subtilis]MEC0312030.1 hypothetical protein [Bacillus subtilis]MEC0363662.1 hypothetical protein [Bacillus subtilis]